MESGSDSHKCGVCVGAAAPRNPLISCAECHAVAHPHCWVPRGRNIADPFTCNPCRQSEDPRCDACGSRSGVFTKVAPSLERKLEGSSGWMHALCALVHPSLGLKCKKGVEIIARGNLDPGKYPCSVCNSDVGLAVQCCFMHPDGSRCASYVHGTCARQSDSASVKVLARGGRVWCTEHGEADSSDAEGLVEEQEIEYITSDEEVDDAKSDPDYVEEDEHKHDDDDDEEEQEERSPSVIVLDDDDDDSVQEICDLTADTPRTSPKASPSSEKRPATSSPSADSASDLFRNPAQFWKLVDKCFGDPNTRQKSTIRNQAENVVKYLQVPSVAPKKQKQKKPKPVAPTSPKRTPRPPLMEPLHIEDLTKDDDVERFPSLAVSLANMDAPCGSHCSPSPLKHISASYPEHPSSGILRFEWSHDSERKRFVPCAEPLELPTPQNGECTSPPPPPPSPPASASDTHSRVIAKVEGFSEEETPWELGPGSVLGELLLLQQQLREQSSRNDITRGLLSGHLEKEQEEPTTCAQEELKVVKEYREYLAKRPPPSPLRRRRVASKNRKDVRETLTVVDSDVVCCVCESGETWEGNEIVFCSKCEIPVHQDCYGVPSLPGGDWMCERCDFFIKHPPKKDRAVSVQCSVCPHSDGALKLSDRPGKFVHAICAIYLPELYFEDSETMRPVLGIRKITRSRRQLRCVFCDNPDRGGASACIQCAHNNCTVAFHASCARLNGAELQEFTTMGSYDTRAYCLRHGRNVPRESIIPWRSFPKYLLEPRAAPPRARRPKSQSGRKPRLKIRTQLKPENYTKSGRVRRKKKRQDVRCDVCRSKKSGSGNARLVSCATCQTAVHVNCYGVRYFELSAEEHTKFGEWQCWTCLSRRSRVKCEVCHRPCGTMTTPAKPFERSNKWCHVVCALFVQCLYFHSDGIGTVGGLDSVLEEQQALVCEICEEQGVCVQCHHAGCARMFHASCAHSADYPLGYNCRSGATAVFCPDHVPEEAPVISITSRAIKPRPSSEFIAPLPPTNSSIFRRRKSKNSKSSRLVRVVPQFAPMPPIVRTDSARKKKKVWDLSPSPVVKHVPIPVKPSQSKSAVPKEDLMDSEEFMSVASCSVCCQDAFDDDAIVFCDRCGVATHQHCGRIKDIPEGDWLCYTCENKITRKKCIACPSPCGLMLPTTDDQLIHATCAYWLKSAVFQGERRPGERFHRCQAETVRKNRQAKNHPCVVCLERGFTTLARFGYTESCQKKGCGQSFHPQCAREANKDMSLKDFKKFSRFDIFCDQHQRKSHAKKYCPPKFEHVKSLVPPFTSCAVCDHNTEFEENTMEQCVKCGLLAHVSCYDMSVKGGKLYCRSCASTKKGTPSCSLCPSKLGLLEKLYGKGARMHTGWLHFTCGLYVEGIGCDARGMSGFHKVPKASRRKECFLCHNQDMSPVDCAQRSACVTCAHQDCTIDVHPQCARDAHFMMNDLDGEFLIYCHDHKSMHHHSSPEEYAKETAQSNKNPPVPLIEEPSSQDEFLCCVCDSNVGCGPDGDILVCEGEGCKVAVHQGCYGVFDIPEGPWLCAPCLAKKHTELWLKEGKLQDGKLPEVGEEVVIRLPVPPRSPSSTPRPEPLSQVTLPAVRPDCSARCAVCPCTKGALSPTDKGMWCHVVCALWLPELFYKDPDRMIGVSGVDKIGSNRQRLQCVACKRAGRDALVMGGTNISACMQCSYPGCRTAFHAQCARENPMGLRLIDSGKNFTGLCHQHSEADVKAYLSSKSVGPVNSIRSPLPAVSPTPSSSRRRRSACTTCDRKKLVCNRRRPCDHCSSGRHPDQCRGADEPAFAWYPTFPKAKSPPQPQPSPTTPTHSSLVTPVKFQPEQVSLRVSIPWRLLSDRIRVFRDAHRNVQMVSVPRARFSEASSYRVPKPKSPTAARVKLPARSALGSYRLWYLTSYLRGQSQEESGPACRAGRRNTKKRVHKDMVSHEVAELQSKEELYCICRHPASDWMIFCECCEEWFHLECLGMTVEEKDKVEHYFCAECTKKGKHKDTPTSNTSGSARSAKSVAVKMDGWGVCYLVRSWS